MTPLPCFLKLLLLILVSASATLGENANELRIHSASELISFSKSVNNGTSYTGTTVYLDSDIDFSGEGEGEALSDKFEPIGKNQSHSFSGTFDGQGHTISNLLIKPSSAYVGLFGVTRGVIQNIVMGPTCFITSNFTGNSDAYVGSVIGYYNPSSDGCSVSNIVNRANATFEGNTTDTSGNLFLGGIIGYIPYSNNYNIIIKNCANYGALTHSGAVSGNAYIGGFIGYPSSSSTTLTYIQNCLNYGSITVSGDGTSGTLGIGGIVGSSYNTAITNCVSPGRIVSSSTSGTIGNIVGYISSNTNITHCLWTSDTDCDSAYGTGTPKTITDTSLVEPNTNTVRDLNEYATSNGWSKWLFNTNSYLVTFKVNNNMAISLSYQLILLPDLAAGGGWRNFTGWYSDLYRNELFQSFEITGDTTLHGGWDKYIVTFDANGGDVTPTFMRVTFNATYGTLPTPSRTGHTFAGWLNDNGDNVTIDNKVTSDHTLYALWELATSYVEIVFETKDLTKDKVKEIIGKYTNETFTIIKFETEGGSDETKVIIKFNNPDAAENFVEQITASSDEGIIKWIDFTLDDGINSFSSTIHPIIVLFSFLVM